MIDLRPFASLGHADHGWLNAVHHFSFANYHDPARMGWGRIRVWNDDTIAAQSGFPPHPHRDMEIITFVRSGAITHQDSLGNKGRTGAGDVQVMSAGTGITHAEFNLETEPTTLFQIWIETDSQGEAPRWGQREFPRGTRAGKWEVVASNAPEADDCLLIRADAKVLAATLQAGETIELQLDPQRHQYLVATGGAIEANGTHANPRDGVAITGVERLVVKALADTELVLVDSR
ncbi:MAG: pirin family protein [Pseudomonadota bacterium]|nr:pirin family protein [Pseudomonadota bacterium]